MDQEFSLKMTEMISTHLGFSNALSLVSLREIEVTYPMKNWISCSLNLLGPGSDVTPLPTTPAIYNTIYPTDEGRTSSGSHGLSEALSLVPLRERDVNYPTKTKIRCADLSGTQQWRHSPPLHRTPWYRHFAKELWNELYSPGAFQRTIACVCTSTGRA